MKSRFAVFLMSVFVFAFCATLFFVQEVAASENLVKVTILKVEASVNSGATPAETAATVPKRSRPPIRDFRPISPV